MDYSNYGLALVATPGDELELKLVYNTGLYSDTAMDAMLADLEGIVRSMGENGEGVELSALGPPSAADLARLTGELGPGEPLAHEPPDVLELFARQVSATQISPQCVAVTAS